MADVADVADGVVHGAVAVGDPVDEKSEKPEKPTQWTRHAVKRLERECNELRAALLKIGFGMDWRAIEQHGIVQGLARLLVNKGLITEDELNGEMLSYTRQVLLSGLQQAEEQRLAASRPQVQAVRQPGLVVARH